MPQTVRADCDNGLVAMKSKLENCYNKFEVFDSRCGRFVSVKRPFSMFELDCGAGAVLIRSKICCAGK